jgi:hypothetical protein
MNDMDLRWRRRRQAGGALVVVVVVVVDLRHISSGSVGTMH